MGTRYRYHGRPWPGLPQRDIEADEAPAFGAVLTEAAARGAYAPEYVHDPLSRMSKAELQDVATAMSLDTDGTKRDLNARITEATPKR